MSQYEINDRNKVKRAPSRGNYDKEKVHAFLDAHFLCHIGFSVEGQPYVIPTAYGREGETIYIHGATKSRLIMALKEGIPCCLTVTHIDGLVMARSIFHHSMNYRSVVVFGKGRELTDEEERMHALKVVSEQICPGRWEEVREPNAKEMKATSVVAIDIEQASAKQRQGPPGDDAEDYDLPIWAGVIPMHLATTSPETDPAMKMELPVSPSVEKYEF